ncbi:Protein of unknown function (DUF1822) [Leptolyngbya sp. PCC 7375]|nr:Protein of unknown function (DUF1822) [Leptolyngbya sp. PCC 7375]
MFSPSALPSESGLRPPEALWLDIDPGDQRLSSHAPSANESEEWQHHLNTLALLGFEQWLQQRNYCLETSQCHYHQAVIYAARLNGFRLNLIVKEHCLDEQAEVPAAAVQQPDRVAHFYVLLEISEEQRRLIVRGFIGNDRLMTSLCQTASVAPGSNYVVPLSSFDLEPNHLLFYSDFLTPATIPLLTAEAALSLSTTPAIAQASTLLGQWIQGQVTAGWQTVEALFGSAAALAWGIRHQENRVKRGKLIDLGLDLQGQAVVLLVTVADVEAEKRSVQVRLHPARGDQYLPPQITLTLLSQTDETLQTVQARARDNYIQLKPFKGLPGSRFSLTVCLDTACLCEMFEL